MFDLIDYLAAVLVAFVAGLAVGYSQGCAFHGGNEEDHLAGEPNIHEIQPPYCEYIGTGRPAYDTEGWRGLCVEKETGRWIRYDEL